MALISLCFVSAIVVVTLLYRHFLKLSKSYLPGYARPLPGPKGLPVIGNVHELPEKNSWIKFHEWGEKYGPIYQVNLAGANHVWITRDRIAHDLLSKRSAIYSDRPFIPALEQDNRTSGQYLPLMSKNEKWTRQRKFAKQIMDTSQKASFYGYPELESIRLLFELMTEPGKYNIAMESFIARVTSRLAWGTSTPSDELKQRARELLIGVSPTGALGNKLPFIMGLPEKVIAAKAWEARRSRTEKKFFETMHSRWSHVEPTLTSDERAFFERNAERIKRQSWRLSPDPRSPQSLSFEAGLPSPTEESDSGSEPDLSDSRKAAVKALTMHANDSAISISGEFMPYSDEVVLPPTPPATPPSQGRKSSTSPSRTSKSRSSPKKPEEKDDPTMNFSTLLIAKPMPFKFNLEIRNKARAELVASKWLDQKMQGEFEDARVYWAGGKVEGNAEFGWGEVFS